MLYVKWVFDKRFRAYTYTTSLTLLCCVLVAIKLCYTFGLVHSIAGNTRSHTIRQEIYLRLHRLNNKYEKIVSGVVPLVPTRCHWQIAYRSGG